MNDRLVTVLLIEDNPLDVRLIQEMLHRSSSPALRLVPVDRLPAGLALLAAGDIDVVLLDLSLPDSRGLPTFVQVHRHSPQVPIVVLTGLDDEEVAVDAVRAGAQDYLVKGQVDSSLLVRALNYAIERKRAENALRDSEALYRTLIETSPDGIALLDGQGTILMANQELARMQGCAGADELLGHNGLELQSARGPGFFSEIKGLVREQRIVRREYLMLRRDGSVYPAEISTAAIEAPGGGSRAVLNIVRDITARREAEEERERLLAAEHAQRIVAETLIKENERLYNDLRLRVQELQRTQAQLVQSAKMAAIGQLAAGVAHELNNPLQSVLGFAELLQRNPAVGEAERGDLSIICEEARRARDIVRRLLDFARKTESSRQKADLNVVVQETVGLLRQRLGSQRIVLEEQYDATLPALQLDVVQIKQVILNLLANALDAMPHGGRLVVVCRRVGNQAVVRVSDSGAGITAQDLPHIFDPFFTTKPVGQGTGLGLSVSLGIVESHGGRIDVASCPGQGSTFAAWLPLADRGPEREAVAASPQGMSAGQNGA